uniref:Activating signal cointegrator 1 n=1 Tax=Schistosoma haematobium TaxID=6185 RepID=A0A095B1L7_SCHHA
MEVDDTQMIKRRVSTLLDTRKMENRQVYEILIREKIRRSGFTGEGYRKSNCSSGVLNNISTSSDKISNSEKIDVEQSSSQTTKNKKKTKFYPLFCEGAQSDQLVSLLPGRHPCQCLATKHQLVNNCLNCGRIVCAQEGSGPCYYCGSLVCTIDEEYQLSLGTAKHSQKLHNKLSQAAWAPGTETPYYRLIRRAQKSKQESTSEIISTESNSNSGLESDSDDNDLIKKSAQGAQIRLEQGKFVDHWKIFTFLSYPYNLVLGLINALCKRDKLLEFDTTCARRTRVIDDELDYFATEGGVGSAAWLSPEVREKIAQRVIDLRAQRHSHRLQSARMCIDLDKCDVIKEDTRDEAAGKLYNPNQEEMDELCKSSTISNVNQSSGDNKKTVNSNNGEITLPTFIPQSMDSKNYDDQNPVIVALNQSTSLLRIQDDESRQLVDEGYCLSLHQPWASLLVRGIKLEEGRTWYTPYRGCLWIASTVNKTDPEEITAIENKYLKAGVPKSDMPTSYPTSCLLGRVNIVNVITQEEYREKVRCYKLMI